MLFRISAVFLSLIIAFLGYQIYDLHSLKSYIYAHEQGQYIGNPNGDIVVAEFLDYSCPQCRSVAPLVTRAVQEDGKALLIPRPIFSQNEYGSVAAYSVYAAAHFDAFMDMHDYMLNNPVPGPENYSQDMALLLGTDEESFENALNRKKVFSNISRNTAMLEALGGNSIPAFLIRHKPSGKEILFFPNPQSQSAEDFTQIFDSLRK